jgi:aspartate aminotransferase-like enzyme
MNLRIPGPTPLPPEVRQALGQDMIGHRHAEFEALLGEVTQHLRHFFQTANDVLVLTASGTGGLEAALVNVLSPGDSVLAVSTGAFGDRLAAIARAFGASVEQLDFSWGQSMDVDVVEQALHSNPDVRLLLTTHSETSTGVLNDLGSLAQVLGPLGESRPLWLVDAVSSLGAVELPMDEWGCDLVISASQKAWMAPPGLAFVALSARAWDANSQARCPRFYWDLATARAFAARGQTPFTPAVSTLYALRASLARMVEEGLPVIVARHRRLAAQLRSGLKRLGLRLFADEAHASPTVTGVYVPEAVSAVEVKRDLMTKHGIAVATGMGPFKDNVLRIAHMGYCSSGDVENVLSGLRAVLRLHEYREA